MRNYQPNMGAMHALGKSAGGAKAMNENHDIARRQGRSASNQALIGIAMQVAGLFIGGGGKGGGGKDTYGGLGLMPSGTGFDIGQAPIPSWEEGMVSLTNLAPEFGKGTYVSGK